MRQLEQEELNMSANPGRSQADSQKLRILASKRQHRERERWKLCIKENGNSTTRGQGIWKWRLEREIVKNFWWRKSGGVGLGLAWELGIVY